MLDLIGAMAYSDITKTSAIVEKPNGEYVWIDSCYTVDHGYETMAFDCDEDGNVSSWNDVYAKRYSSIEEMKIGHSLICRNFRTYGSGNAE